MNVIMRFTLFKRMTNCVSDFYIESEGAPNDGTQGNYFSNSNSMKTPSKGEAGGGTSQFLRGNHTGTEHSDTSPGRLTG